MHLDGHLDVHLDGHGTVPVRRPRPGPGQMTGPANTSRAPGPGMFRDMVPDMVTTQVASVLCPEPHWQTGL
ncbi:hypothetical protein GCM10010517_22970 [Streptosporangium fragile]|uniref:Uncharacterized protein n=1 Tax=Streptosporangium fragile TaxID=46186 RepID=A0ABN3VUS8_9ACTN